MTSLHVICSLGFPNQIFWLRLQIGDCLKNFFEDLFFFFFLESTCGCVLGPWPRALLSLASRGSVLGRAVLGLGLGFFCVLGLGLEPCVLDSTSDKNVDEKRTNFSWRWKRYKKRILWNPPLVSENYDFIYHFPCPPARRKAWRIKNGSGLQIPLMYR